MNLLFSKIFINTISALYLWVIGLCIGSLLCAGALSAPVIFGANDFGVHLSRFQSGILMTQIFMRLNVVLLVGAFFIATFETFALRLSSHKAINKALLFLSGAISVICILLFSLYYSPYILAQQELGEMATASKEFASMHEQSEMVAGILFCALSFNFVYRILLKR